MAPATSGHVLPLGALFPFIGRQLGRILSPAFSWATMELFGRVPEDRQLVLSLMPGGVAPLATRSAGLAYALPDRVLGFLRRRAGGEPGARQAGCARRERRRGRDPSDGPRDEWAQGPFSRARAAIARELTFTKAFQTWTTEAQDIEDALARAARGDGDLDAIARNIADAELDFEQ